MNLVFYDTETTGTNTTFDQILQFAAILTDEEFNEIDRFEIRCRILPWVIPAPGALLVTGVSPAQLTDPSLPTHYQMMCQVKAKLDAWSPARFIGYNSMSFDEALLQRALWQTLHPPWLTVTNGNARLDVLPLVQAASYLAPQAISIPQDDNGRQRFKLDKLAPLNGFDHDKAHDALGDVEATIHVAKQLFERAAPLWQTAVARAPKRETEAILLSDAPVVICEYFGSPNVWVGRCIGFNPNNPSSYLVARIDAGWPTLLGLDDQELGSALKKSPRPVRTIAANKSPLVYSIDEAQDHWDIRADQHLLQESERLVADPATATRIMTAWSEITPPWPEAEYLEQSIYDGFPDRDDEQRMAAFHQSDWAERARMVRTFEDQRLRQLAQRLVYVEAPHFLDAGDKQRLDHAIADRLLNDPEDKMLWRSLPGTRKELAKMDRADPAVVAIERYFDEVESNLASRIHACKFPLR